MTSIIYHSTAALDFGQSDTAVMGRAQEAQKVGALSSTRQKPFFPRIPSYRTVQQSAFFLGFFTSIAAVSRTIDMPMSGADDREPDALIEGRRSELAGGITENEQQAIDLSVWLTTRALDNGNQTFGGCSSEHVSGWHKARS